VVFSRVALNYSSMDRSKKRLDDGEMHNEPMVVVLYLVAVTNM